MFVCDVEVCGVCVWCGGVWVMCGVFGVCGVELCGVCVWCGALWGICGVCAMEECAGYVCAMEECGGSVCGVHVVQ